MPKLHAAGRLDKHSHLPQSLTARLTGSADYARLISVPMINFRLENKEYMIGNTVLPVKELLSYPHEINGDKGFIDIPYGVGDKVIRYASTLSRKALIGGQKRTIKSFTVVGGSLCVMFEEGGGAHSVECIAPADDGNALTSFFDGLRVGSEVEARESKGSRWLKCTVTAIDGDNITFEDPDGMEVDSDKEEVNEQVFFRPALVF